MVNFEKIDEMIEYIENNEFYNNYTPNDFFIEFFKTVQVIPLSKYLRNKNKVNRLPKIMNAKKAGEILFLTYKDEDIINYIKNKGYDDIPQLSYKTIMLLRKVTLNENWDRIFEFLEGKGTVAILNKKNQRPLLPEEKTQIEKLLCNELEINNFELVTLINKMKKIHENKDLSKAFNKLLNT